MKKSPSGQTFHQSSKRRQSKDNSNNNFHGSSAGNYDTKTTPFLTSFKSAVKKYTSVFSLIFLGKSKRSRTALNLIELDDRKNSSTSKSRGLSCSVNSSKSSSKWKFSYSYASSSTAVSGQLELGNFTFEEIYKSTSKFSPENQIGEGGFGIVYKGKLSDGSLVAVKRAKKDLNRHLFEFKNEIYTLSKIEHLNLVRLYGYLEYGDEKIIVVEYVANGTLREHLDGNRGDGLEIGERLDIAIDVAHAVTYLHMYTDNPIIHRDIKASNILITENLRAKVADFGFARLSDDPNATHISTQVKGTAGYLDPEYLRTYQLTEKSDVYSFGVLLVEIITGRHPIQSKKPPEERVTIKWAMKLLKQGDAMIAMDPRMRRMPASKKAAKKVLMLALQCLASSKQLRPSMKRCAEVLWGIRKDFRDETTSIPPPLIPSHHSADFARREKNMDRLLGIEDYDDDDSYKFVSVP